MTYKQSTPDLQYLHNSQYDVSFDPANYDPTFEGDRASKTKRYRIPNPKDPGNFIYYNVVAPFYSPHNDGIAFCYSPTSVFDGGTEDPITGPWDYSDCYLTYKGVTDSESNYSDFYFGAYFSPTDSDYAMGILDFGVHSTWQYVSKAWFSNTSPGGGYLHLEVDDVNTSHATQLKNKLDTMTFSGADTPIRNAGLTPLEGTLNSCLLYTSPSPRDLSTSRMPSSA